MIESNIYAAAKAFLQILNEKAARAYYKDIPKPEDSKTELKYDPFTKSFNGKIHGQPLEKMMAPKALIDDLVSKRGMKPDAASSMVQKHMEPWENEERIQYHLGLVDRWKEMVKKATTPQGKKGQKAVKLTPSQKLKRRDRVKKMQERMKIHQEKAKHLGYDPYIWKQMQASKAMMGTGGPQTSTVKKPKKKK